MQGAFRGKRLSNGLLRGMKWRSWIRKSSVMDEIQSELCPLRPLAYDSNRILHSWPSWGAGKKYWTQYAVKKKGETPIQDQSGPMGHSGNATNSIHQRIKIKIQANQLYNRGSVPRHPPCISSVIDWGSSDPTFLFIISVMMFHTPLCICRLRLNGLCA